MEEDKFLQISSQYYYIEHRITILKCYEKVHLVKIKILDTEQIIVVDRSAISLAPIFENTISIEMLGGS